MCVTLNEVFTTPMETKLKLTQGDANNLPDIPYRELVCLLLFIARYARPDICLLLHYIVLFPPITLKCIRKQPNGFYTTQQVPVQ
jgi:hypothetical protein